MQSSSVVTLLVMTFTGAGIIGLQNGIGMIFCLLYTSDAADERSSVDLGGRRIIKKKNNDISHVRPVSN